MSKQLLLLGWILFFMTGFFNCPKSPSYREEALDISGSYQSTKDSGLDMDFRITNDNGFYDILITLNRKSPLTEREKQLLRDNGFSVTRVEKKFAKAFILGSGFESDRTEGENYSTDKGTTSQFFVCSPEPDIQSAPQGGLLEAGYCLSGQFIKSSREISGTLSLNVFSNSLKQNPDGSFVSESKGKVELKYKAQAIP